MQLGVIDLAGPGAAIARRLLAGGHACVVFDKSCRLVAELGAERAYGAASVRDLVNELDAPRAILLAGPAATVDGTIAELLPQLEGGDIIIVCANGSYLDDVRRATTLAESRIYYVDLGVNGQSDSAHFGCRFTIGGEEAIVRYLDPIFATLAQGASPSREAEPSAEPAACRYLYCGPAGAGHFVSTIHDGIESCLMAAYAEGLGVLHAATRTRPAGACHYDFDLPAITALWRRGSSIASPVLDRTAEALAPHVAGQDVPRGKCPRVDWTAIRAAAEQAVPVPVLAAAMSVAGRARHDTGFSSKLLRAMQQS